jgi:hypothetical protein
VLREIAPLSPIPPPCFIDSRSSTSIPQHAYRTMTAAPMAMAGGGMLLTNALRQRNRSSETENSSESQPKHELPFSLTPAPPLQPLSRGRTLTGRCTIWNRRWTLKRVINFILSLTWGFGGLIIGVWMAIDLSNRRDDEADPLAPANSRVRRHQRSEIARAFFNGIFMSIPGWITAFDNIPPLKPADSH